MAAKKGIVRNPKGRPKGTLNKRTQAIQEKLAALKCDPIKGMADIASAAMEKGDLSLAGSMYKELAQYVASKRRSIEVTGEDGGPLVVEIIRFADAKSR